jgi:hypothetical protein
MDIFRPQHRQDQQVDGCNRDKRAWRPSAVQKFFLEQGQVNYTTRNKQLAFFGGHLDDSPGKYEIPEKCSGVSVCPQGSVVYTDNTKVREGSLYFKAFDVVGSCSLGIIFYTFFR